MAINAQNVEMFKFIAHKIIPLVYDDSLSYYEFLCEVMQKLNEVISSLDNQNEILKAFDEEILDWETSTDNKYNQFVSNINTLFEAFTQGEVAVRTAFMDALIGSYNASTHYAAGQYVRYGNNVYKCTTATSGETWNPAHWTQVVYADDLSERQSDYEESITAQQNAFETEITGQQTTFEQSEVVARTAFMDALIGSYNASTHYAAGQYVRYGNNVYKCTTATSGETWNPAHWTQVVYADDLSESITEQLSTFETWTFTMVDGTTVTKRVVVL